MARRLNTGRIYVGLLVAILVALVVSFVVRQVRGDSAPALPPDVGIVDHVVDGDTIDVAIADTTERVRLIGIDTPEIAHPGDDTPAECFGPDAATFTSEQLPAGSEVKLVRDIVGRDDYGRLLAYVYRRPELTFINEAIVAAGYARPFTIAPNDANAATFVAAATLAEAANLGLWGACAR